MEDAAEQIIGLYRRHAAAWASSRGGLMERDWLDRFVQLVTLGGSILDIGCGPGKPLARYLVDRGYEVTGVDSSPEMLNMFTQNVPEAQTHQADMRTLDLDTTFDGLLAWDSFFHLSIQDQRQMFEVFAAHASPDAALMFTSGPAQGVAIGELEGEPLHHASLDPNEYRSLLDSTGFHVVDYILEDPSCGGHTVWLSQRAGAC